MTHFEFYLLPREPAGVRTVEELAEFLMPLGVVLEREYGDRVYTADALDGTVMRRCGSVRVRSDGEIAATPHLGSSDTDRRVLLLRSQMAFTQRPSRRNGWLLRRDGGRSSWSKHVWIEAEGGDPVAAVARASESQPSAGDLPARVRQPPGM